MLSCISLRQKPELKEEATTWFHDKWGISRQAYLDCLDANLDHQTEYGWFLCPEGKRIVGGLGVIENDFHERTDLTPNICAVYTEAVHRGQGIAGRLLDMACADLKSKGISPVYLVTDLIGFYKQYDWQYLCDVR